MLRILRPALRPPPSSRAALGVSRLLALAAMAVLVLLSGAALAGSGSFTLKSHESTEVAGMWRIFVKIQLPKPPATAHQSLRFIFTKTVAYERSLVDGKSEPVVNRQTLQNQNPMVESLDVGFSDATGKIYPGTNFDFALKRERGFEAGEYKLQVRTSDNVEIGSATNLILKGDNPVVDRRSIAFNAKDTSIKKYHDGVDAGPAVAKNDEVAPSTMEGDVKPTGEAAPFVSKDAFNRTPEEDIKLQKPSGCGCDVPGMGGGAPLFAAPLLALGALAAARSRKKREG
ncbi:MAG TPA: hypothetical protein PLR99_02485 [Polyangiaceae bacterium]|nr:hypothetical protein [Polyangiaceae bacterium]